MYDDAANVHIWFFLYNVYRMSLEDHLLKADISRLKMQGVLAYFVGFLDWITDLTDFYDKYWSKVLALIMINFLYHGIFDLIISNQWTILRHDSCEHTRHKTRHKSDLTQSNLAGHLPNWNRLHYFHLRGIQILSHLPNKECQSKSTETFKHWCIAFAECKNHFDTLK